MEYTPNLLKEKVHQYGEVFVVLDSGEEYIIHGYEGYTVLDSGDAVRVEGMQGDEYVVAEFPFDSIEHIYTHKEV